MIWLVRKLISKVGYVGGKEMNIYIRQFLWNE